MKKYEKPEVVKVKLELKNPILGSCQQLNTTDPASEPCDQTGGCNFAV